MKRQSTDSLSLQDDPAKRPKRKISESQPDKEQAVPTVLQDGESPTSRLRQRPGYPRKASPDIDLSKFMVPPPPLGFSRFSMFADRQERVSMFETILNETEDIDKIRGTLAAERMESATRKKCIDEMSSDVMLVHRELRVQKEKNTFHEKLLAQHKKDISHLRVSSSVEKERSASLEMRNKELGSELRTAQGKLEEEMEKSLCNICMERQRNALTLPCLHLCLCSQCLETHLKKSKTCPFCRLEIKGTLECVV